MTESAIGMACWSSFTSDYRNPPFPGARQDTHLSNDEGSKSQTSKVAQITTVEQKPLMEDTGRERLKRHRLEVAGRVWIPEIWGQEELLKDWTDCSAFDASLFPTGIVSARAALVQQGRRGLRSR